MWGWIKPLIEGLIAPFLQWYQTYHQGRNAEQARAAREAADLAARVSEAQSRTPAVRVDDDWLHRGSPTGKAAPVPPPGHPPTAR